MPLDARKRASTNIPNGPAEPNRQKRQICFTFASRKCSLPFGVPWGALGASFLSGAGCSHGDQKLLHVSLHGTFTDLHGVPCFIVSHEIWTKTASDFRIFEKCFTEVFTESSRIFTEPMFVRIGFWPSRFPSRTFTDCGTWCMLLKSMFMLCFYLHVNDLGPFTDLHGLRCLCFNIWLRPCPLLGPVFGNPLLRHLNWLFS